MKKLIIIIGSIILITGIGVGIFFFVNSHNGNENEANSIVEEMDTASEHAGAILENSRLTDDEKILTGVWESDEGWILGVRERALGDTSFALDAIIYCPEFDQWFKVTREDGSFVSETGSGLEFSDLHDCPVSKDSNSMQETKEELIYDEKSDIITYTCYAGSETISWASSTGYVTSIAFHRTDKDIIETDAGWDWYYEIEKSRDPR
ncbi:MAG: hypothetical protein ACERKN_02125 [Velocimicrobium sp.]